MKSINYIFSVLIITLLSVNFAHAGKERNFVGKELLLNAKGTATAFACEIPPTDMGTTEALCFKVPLYNMKTGAFVGMMTDRLADVQPSDNGGLLVTATSTFNFTEWKRKPSFTTRVLGTAQPFLGGSESMTHLTGYIPNAGTNNIIASTGRFRYLSASARESGAINLQYFSGQPGDEVTFDLVWVITFN